MNGERVKPGIVKELVQINSLVVNRWLVSQEDRPNRLSHRVRDGQADIG